MRRSVTTVMSVVSLAVVAGSLRASSLPAAPHLAAVGIVLDPGRSAAPGLRPPAPTAAAVSPPAVAPDRLATTGPPQPVRPTGPARVAVAPAVHPQPARTAGSPPAAVHRPSPSPAPSSVTVNGAPADTKYGPVQVQITLTDGRIVRAEAIDYPQGSSRDRSINEQAVPQLDQETVQAQSDNIDTVSGATYTSAGYRQSLQSALDAAHAR